MDAQYATLLVALWEPRHAPSDSWPTPASEPPLIWRRGEIIKPRVEGVPIGLLEDREYEQLELTMRAGGSHRVLFRRRGRSAQRQGRGFPAGVSRGC